MKTGRNDPCPCGSTKKYKKCCLNKNNVIPAIDLAYRRISKVYKELELKLEKYMATHFDTEIIEGAIDEFFCWPYDEDDYFPEDAIYSFQDLYRPWILYNWDCGPDLYENWDEEDGEITIAQVYMKKNIKKISTMEKNLITAISQKPYCFWEVSGVKPDECIDLKNIMTGETITVREHMGLESVKPEHIIFARAVVVENVGMLIGMGQTIIPAREKLNLLELRKEIIEDRPQITNEDLLEWEIELREVYLDIHHRLTEKPWK